MTREWTSPYLDRLGETVDPPAFSNGTEFYSWMANYCDNCWHDRKARQGREDLGCGLIAEGMMHEPVAAWVYTDRMWPAHVHCLKFTPEDEGPDEGPPTPRPTPPGQEAMFDPSAFDWDRTSEPAEVSS